MKDKQTEEISREKWIVIDGVRDRLTPDPERVAIRKEDGAFYETWISEGCYRTPYLSVGRIGFVFDGDEILATIWPMFDYDENFDFINVEKLEKQGRRYAAYQEFCKSNVEVLSHLPEGEASTVD